MRASFRVVTASAALVRHAWVLAFLLAAISAGALAAAPFKVLVVGLPDDNHPQTGAAGIKAVQEIAAGQDYTVDAITDITKVNDAFLAPYQVMVCVMAWPGDWPKAVQASFEKYIQSGKGWIGFHVSGLVGISNPEWTWYQDWLGGVSFKGHPATRQNGNVKVEAAATADAALAGIPAQFSIHEEWYAWTKSPRGAPDIKILAAVDEGTYDPGGSAMGKDHPVMWSNGKYGPMIYTSLGHEPEAFANANVRKFLANAIPWAAKATPAAARPTLGRPVPRETPVLRWEGGRLSLVFAGGARGACDARGRAFSASFPPVR